MPDYKMPVAGFVKEEETENSPFVVYLNSFFNAKQAKYVGAKTKAKFALDVLQNGINYPSFNYMFEHRTQYREFMVFCDKIIISGLTNQLPIPQIVNTILAFKFPAAYAIKAVEKVEVRQESTEAVRYK